MKAYDHKKIEKKWQESWAKSNLYKTPDTADGKDNFYLLVEFPYPSGNLHVGHWYAYAVPDIFARTKRMQGSNVLYPIGFDAFGLPAENAAIKNKLNPREWTEKNIAYMKTQIASMGTSLDWSREIATIDPKYYRWTQWLFLQFFKNGLVYRKETAVNWCPKDKTVLANEQVVGGRCERCDSIVEQRNMLQWNIKITNYADRLIDDLNGLDWPEQIKESQKNWIGRSEGAQIDFPLVFDTDRKYTYVLLHGFEGTPDAPRFQFWKQELEKLGHKVIIPALPNSHDPHEKAQVDAALSAVAYDENTILFGHSLGGVVALKVLERLQKPIAFAVFAGSFADPNFKDKHRPFEQHFTWEFDAKKILSNVRGAHVLHDPADPAVSEAQAQTLAGMFNSKVQFVDSEKPHFTGLKESSVLMWLRPTMRVFTTRPDTLFGATYLVLAPEHPWVTLALGHKTVLKNHDEVQKYVDQAKRKTELERQADQKEKTGVELKGVSAINPATGEKIPMYVADYVLGHYGTGAIMAVPAHDERDWDFAKAHHLPIKQAVSPVFGSEDKREDAVHRDAVACFVRDDSGNVLLLRWKKHEWITPVIGGIEEGETPAEAAVREVLEETGYRAKVLFVSPIVIESHFFAEHKDEWRSRIDHSVLLELESDQKGPLSQEEIDTHDTCWYKAEEAPQHLMFGNNKLSLDLALGKVTAYTEPRYGEKQVLVNSGPYNGMEIAEAKRRMTEMFGTEKKTYRLRDWIVSRQRYWGVPIPIIHCADCGAVAVPDKDLPVRLPEIDDYLPTGDGESPLAKAKDWVQVSCPKCGKPARRETDTLDTFVDSSWYFLRYTDPKNEHAFADPGKMNHWMPVSLYSGGAEHTTMHLLYSRFWQKAMYDLGLVKDPEPYRRRMNRSLIMGPDGQKMSKSRGNVIDPDEVVERLGADTVRMYLAFIGPYNEVASYPWNPDGVVGVRRFLERVWKVHYAYVQKAGEPNEVIGKLLHRTIKKVGDDNLALKFNTAISAMMIFLNAIEKEKAITVGQWETFLKLLAPFAPHMAEELWHDLGYTTSIHVEPWPMYEEAFLKDDVVTIAVQINGKARGTIQIAADADEATARHEAEKNPTIAKYLEQGIKKIIYVPGRILNLIVE